MNTKARVIAHYRGKYRVRSSQQEFWVEITGKMIHTAQSPTDYPVVGDWVMISELDDDNAIIHEILPRQSMLQRKAVGKDSAQVIASNIDVAFIIQAVDRDFNLNRFERYLSLCAASKIKTAIILNKIDLISEAELEDKFSQTKTRFKDIDILVTSVPSNIGLEGLVQFLNKEKTYCFLGSSGVGKSSLINKLLGKNVLATKNISLSTKKGKHTTTHRELFVLENGAFVIDNPGMREVGLTDAGIGIEKVFDEIVGLSQQCRFSDCSHTHESGCNVLAAVKTDKLDSAKYENYVKMKKEADFYALSSREKRQKDRKFGKMVHRTMKFKKEHK